MHLTGVSARLQTVSKPPPPLPRPCACVLLHVAAVQPLLLMKVRMVA